MAKKKKKKAKAFDGLKQMNDELAQMASGWERSPLTGLMIPVIDAQRRTQNNGG